MVSVLISIILAIILTRIKKRRKIILITTGILGYVLSTFFSLLFMSDFHMALADFPAMLMVAFYSMIAFSLIVIPLLVFAMLVLEKWTREKVILKNQE
jgi:heme exporter protein D